MKNKVIVGIDVSKKVLDAYILSVKFPFTVENSPPGFAQLLEIVIHQLKGNATGLMFCFENTGRYSRPLSVFLKESGHQFIVLNALDLKRSMGITRGKTDQLRQLLSLRELMIRHRTARKNTVQDLYDCYVEGESDFIRVRMEEMRNHLDEQIQRVEERIYITIESRPEIMVNYRLLMSVRGIGKVLAAYFIMLTGNFTRFIDPEKFVCYAGIAPFEYSSGISVR